MSDESPERRDRIPARDAVVTFIPAMISHSPEETARVGEILGTYTDPGRLLALRGEMGAGKTCLVQGIARGMGVPGDCLVTSPTFTLINEYPTNRGIMLYHFDLYRLGDEEELFDLGYEEYWFSDGISAVEWPEIAKALLPENRIDIYLSIVGDSARSIWVEILGEGIPDLHRELLHHAQNKEGS
ncbi:MAG: tRNA (adenosine(37)-N6)-threonylcarbamoyltransferase complex ATPase subunit type 1 TsaE [Deltaproteobacteria bacterium]|nr:tRNA (adenosine(37)-N6)-threonylcarbamoyltransferase complex ATPase subunit type 1 TsaE [Candidatus Zymogenaceae bacterium]